MTETDWPAIRAKFALDPDWIDFTRMSLASHPEPVRKAIETHRAGLDASPLRHVYGHFHDAEDAVAGGVERYFGTPARLVAATSSTTMGLAQVYGGLRVKPGHEFLISRQEHSTTVEILQGRRRREGTPFRQVTLFEDGAEATEAEILANLEAEIRPQTRALALVWVYSSNGLKMPIQAIAGLVKQENQRRGASEDALLLCVDGVHGFGVEDVSFQDLGCDLFIAGCHKWIFGPRGTAIICGTEAAWREVVPLVPTFSDTTAGPGKLHTPGGIHAYEHVWALAQAFEFVLGIRKSEIQQRVRQLVRRAKDGLKANPRIRVRTPDSEDLSSGIVCFDVEEYSAEEVRNALWVHKPKPIILTPSAWDAALRREHVRVSISIVNHEAEIDALLQALAALPPK